MAIKCVIFDFDGTIKQSVATLAEAYYSAVEGIESGAEIFSEIIREFPEMTRYSSCDLFAERAGCSIATPDGVTLSNVTQKHARTRSQHVRPFQGHMSLLIVCGRVTWTVSWSPEHHSKRCETPSFALINGALCQRVRFADEETRSLPQYPSRQRENGRHFSSSGMVTTTKLRRKNWAHFVRKGEEPGFLKRRAKRKCPH